jgi:thioredoxin reductase
VKSSQKEYLTKSVLLTIGRRGTPRPLDVRGEQQAKVVYRLVDPEQYRGMHVLVVGGGDSAIEAALACSGQPGTTVSLSYRGPAFNRIKPGNRERLATAESGNRLQVFLESDVMEIRTDTVALKRKAKLFEFPNQAVIVCAGGILPTGLLKKLGVEVEVHYGE